VNTTSKVGAIVELARELSSPGSIQMTTKGQGYLHLFPHNTFYTDIYNERINHSVPTESPLLRYRPFGGDQFVENIFHNDRNWVPAEFIADIPGVEILANYSVPEHKVDTGPAIWSYEEANRDGRVVLIGSHPEIDQDGETRELLEVCFLYTLDGTRLPKSKGELIPGEVRVMNRATPDEDPAHTKIGGGQIHYFDLEVPSDRSTVKLKIEGQKGFQFNFYLNRDHVDFGDKIAFEDRRPGFRKFFGERKTIQVRSRATLARRPGLPSLFCAMDMEARVPPRPRNVGFLTRPLFPPGPLKNFPRPE